MNLVPMFPRGSGPLASVMISSRGRTAALERCMRKAHDLATNKNDIEFTIKADDDDPDTINTVVKLANELKLAYNLVVTPRGRGFLEMAEWVNMMSQKSKGDWLILLNDDAYIDTPGWDNIIATAGVTCPRFGYESISLFMLKEYDQPKSFAFPCLRRKVVDILGYFAPGIACDEWIRRIIESIALVSVLPIWVRHERAEHEGKETREGIIGANQFMVWQLTSIEGLREYCRAAARIVDWMGKEYDKLEWKSAPEGDGWYWWKQGSVALTFLVYVSGSIGLQMGMVISQQPEEVTIADLGGLWAVRPN